MRTGHALVGHLDADCFYVSAERVRSDFLRGKPVGVLGNQGACVIAKSEEMKKAGVKTGEPIWEAIGKCPSGIYVKRDFRWYEVLSDQMRKVLREISTCVERYSVDEFFFDATPPRGTSPQEYAERIRDTILDVVRVPVTVGIARTRTLAKLAAEVAKPAGALAVLDVAGEEALLDNRPVTEIAGIAGRRERRLAVWNVRTCLDLARADRGLIRRILTVPGEILWCELNGEQIQPIRSTRPPHKMFARGGSLGEPTAEPVVLFAWLVRNLERLIVELEYHEVLAGRLTVNVDYMNGAAGVGQAGPMVPSDRFDVLLDTARPCLRRAWVRRIPATRMHLTADRLTLRRNAPLALFDPPGTSDRAEALARVKRDVNTRVGRFTLRSGATLPLNAIYRDPANSYDIGDIRDKFCF